MRKSQYFPFWMFSAIQGHYWYHFYNVFGMTRSLTGDWTRDLPHSKPALYHYAIEEAVECSCKTLAKHKHAYTDKLYIIHCLKSLMYSFIIKQLTMQKVLTICPLFWFFTARQCERFPVISIPNKATEYWQKFNNFY